METTPATFERSARRDEHFRDVLTRHAETLAHIVCMRIHMAASEALNEREDVLNREDRAYWTHEDMHHCMTAFNSCLVDIADTFTPQPKRY